MANWGLMAMVLAIFLYFTGMWRMIAERWNAFFSSNMWTQTISNIKTTWSSPPTTGQTPPPAPFK